MQEEHTKESLESTRDAYEREQLAQEREPYTPRPKWQIVMAWVLIAIVVLGIINLCYWQIRG